MNSAPPSKYNVSELALLDQGLELVEQIVTAL